MSVELPKLPEPVRTSSDQAYLGFTADQMREYARRAVDIALERAAQECRVICSKNHADAATFKNGTKAYVQACDDCDDAIRALKSEGAGQ